jgi:5,10-methylenetetrahydromethanopterin reductase
MMAPKKLTRGIMFRREYPPEHLPAFARRAEELGFDAVWIVEDCFYASGIAAAAVALAATTSVQIGLGIMPAVVRNPVFAAMEIATLARLYPGRFLPGFGHGVLAWMQQVGAAPASQLRALEEVTTTVRQLLRGEEITFQGQHVQIEGAKLIWPPTHVPPITLGVIGPKSLALAGRVADGVILSEYSSPAYVSWAKAQVLTGMRDAGEVRASQLTVFTFACAEPSREAAQRRLRPLVRAALPYRDIDPKLAAMGILDAVQAARASGPHAIDACIQAEWLEQLAIGGTPRDWHTAIARYQAQEVDSLVLVPLPDTAPEELERLAAPW